MNSLTQAWYEWQIEYQRDHGPMRVADALLMEEAFLAGASATLAILASGSPQTLLDRALALSTEMHAWLDDEDVMGRDPG